MKATCSEKYYRESFDMFLEKYERRFYCDYEGDLAVMLERFHLDELPKELPEATKAEMREFAISICAKKIADEARPFLVRQMNIIKAVKAGKAEVGDSYNPIQALRDWGELVEGFEFACYALAQFKKNHGI